MNKKIWFILIVWWIGVSVLVSRNKFEASDLPSSISEYHLKDKEIDESHEAGGLSYGPYKFVNTGKYIIGLHYNASQDGNSIKITQDLGRKEVTSAQLVKGKKWGFIKVDIEKEGALEVVTLYNGKGKFAVYSLYILSVRTCLNLCFLLIILTLLLLLLLKNRKVEILNSTLVLIIILTLICWLNDYSLLCSIVSIYLYLGYYLYQSTLRQGKIKTSAVFLADIVAIGITELLNSFYYEFLSFHTSLFSILIFLNIYLFLYFVIKNFKTKIVIIKIMTVLVLLYASSQYIYYSFFKDFFRLKVILLARTAANVTQSVSELLARYPAKCYCINLILYVFICLEILFLYFHKRKIVVDN